MTTTFVAVSLTVASTLTALAAVDLQVVNASGTPGQTAKVRLQVSNAVHLTAGQFNVSVSAAGAPPVALSAVKAGQAATAAGNCDGCTPSGTPDSFFTNATGNPSISAVFLLPSDCEAGFLQNGDCAAGHETGGISGNNQELAQVWVNVPADAPIGTVYNVVLGDQPDFSDAGSTSVPVTVANGTLTVAESTKGDLNGDSGTTISDALIALRNIVGLVTLDSGQQQAADVNCDGNVTISDALLMLRFIVGIITDYPCQ